MTKQHQNPIELAANFNSRPRDDFAAGYNSIKRNIADHAPAGLPYTPHSYVAWPNKRKARAEWVRAELTRRGAQILDLGSVLRIRGTYLDITVEDLADVTDNEVEAAQRIPG